MYIKLPQQEVENMKYMEKYSKAIEALTDLYKYFGENNIDKIISTLSSYSRIYERQNRMFGKKPITYGDLLNYSDCYKYGINPNDPVENIFDVLGGLDDEQV